MICWQLLLNGGLLRSWRGGTMYVTFKAYSRWAKICSEVVSVPTYLSTLSVLQEAEVVAELELYKSATTQYLGEVAPGTEKVFWPAQFAGSKEKVLVWTLRTGKRCHYKRHHEQNEPQQTLPPPTPRHTPGVDEADEKAG